jgi:hypothetical protein
MSGKDIYEENRRLKDQVENLREQVADLRDHNRNEANWMTAAFLSFLGGDAALVVTDGNDPGSKVIYFQAPAALVKTKPVLPDSASTPERI